MSDASTANELVRHTAAEIAHLVSQGTASAEEVTRAHTGPRRCGRRDVHAFLHVDSDGARGGRPGCRRASRLW